MSRTAHIFLFIGYVIVAAIVGLTFPGGVLNVEDNGAWLLAGMVFLVGLLLHEMIARRQNEMTALRRLLVLRRAYDGAHEELERTRDEVRRVYEAMESVGQDAAEGGRELQEVASEVKVLHDLVEELLHGHPRAPTQDGPQRLRLRRQRRLDGRHGLSRRETFGRGE